MQRNTSETPWHFSCSLALQVMVSKREEIRIRERQELEIFFGGLQKNTGEKYSEGKSGTFRQEINYGYIIPECKNKMDLLLKPFVKTHNFICNAVYTHKSNTPPLFNRKVSFLMV